MALIEEAHKAAELLLDHAYVRIVAREDPDALCAAVLLGHALRREKVDFHFSTLPRLSAPAAQRLAEGRHEGLVLVGLGGDDEDGRLVPGRKVVLDREATTLEGEAMLDPSRMSEKSPDAPLAAFAYFVAVSMSKRNRDLALLAMAGTLADGQHVPRVRGLAADVLAQAQDEGNLVVEPGLALHGPNLETALAQLESPYVSGVTGRARNVKRLLQEMRIGGEAPPGGLSPDARERLGSFLTLRLLGQEAPDAALATLYRPQVRAAAGPYTGLDAAALARQAEAACASGRAGLGFAALWPDASAGSELLPLQGAWRDGLVAGLLKAERERQTEGPLTLVDAPDARACPGFALRAAASLAPEGHVALARHVDENGRATLALRAHGREDVGRAARKAAEAAGCRVAATRTSARTSTGDATRFLKAFVEALG